MRRHPGRRIHLQAVGSDVDPGNAVTVRTGPVTSVPRRHVDLVFFSGVGDGRAQGPAGFDEPHPPDVIFPDLLEVAERAVRHVGRPKTVRRHAGIPAKTEMFRGHLQHRKAVHIVRAGTGNIGGIVRRIVDVPGQITQADIIQGKTLSDGRRTSQRINAQIGQVPAPINLRPKKYPIDVKCPVGRNVSAVDGDHPRRTDAGCTGGAEINGNVARETGGNLKSHIQIIIKGELQIRAAGKFQQRHLRVAAPGRAGEQPARHARGAGLRGGPILKIGIGVPLAAAPVICQRHGGINDHCRRRCRNYQQQAGQNPGQPPSVRGF